ncbi:hypothetical protein GA0115260_102452 [Streptomyces sp. MnatMP-M27]|nr:hypothetical protein GA0115260_102452 [Streptomyces sp. MnatMP-M27]
MRRKRRPGYGPDLDPVSRYVGEDVLGRELRRLFKPGQRQLLLEHMNGVSLDQLARRHGLSVRVMEQYVARMEHRLSTSEHADTLLQELRDRHGPKRSPEVRAVAEELRPHRCARVGCTAPPFPQAARGRTRLYCSDRCKVAHHRWRERTAMAKRETTGGGETRMQQPQRPKYRWRDYSDALPELPAPRDATGPWAAFLQVVDSRLQEPQVKAEALPPPTTISSGAGRAMASSALITIGTGKTYALIDGNSRAASPERVRLYRVVLWTRETQVDPARTLTGPMKARLSQPPLYTPHAGWPLPELALPVPAKVTWPWGRAPTPRHGPVSPRPRSKYRPPRPRAPRPLRFRRYR